MLCVFSHDGKPVVSPVSRIEPFGLKRFQCSVDRKIKKIIVIIIMPPNPYCALVPCYCFYIHLLLLLWYHQWCLWPVHTHLSQCILKKREIFTMIFFCLPILERSSSVSQFCCFKFWVFYLFNFCWRLLQRNENTMLYEHPHIILKSSSPSISV